MRVLLVGPDLESNLSLRYLASSLEAAGHQPRIATFDTLDDAPSVLTAAKGAELIGLSMCFQVRAPEFLSLARQLKAAAPARPIIAGGHFASCAATGLLDELAEEAPSCLGIEVGWKVLEEAPRHQRCARTA